MIVCRGQILQKRIFKKTADADVERQAAGAEVGCRVAMADADVGCRVAMADADVGCRVAMADVDVGCRCLAQIFNEDF